MQFFHKATFLRRFSNTDDIRRQSRTLYIALSSIGQKQQRTMLVSCVALSSSGRRIHSAWAHSLHQATPVCWHICISLMHYRNAGQVVCLSKPRVKNSTDVFRRIKLETVRHYGTSRFNHARHLRTKVTSVLAIGNYTRKHSTIRAFWNLPSQPPHQMSRGQRMVRKPRASFSPL